LELYTDSKIVTEQLLTNYAICEPVLGTYHARTAEALSHVTTWSVQHVHREVLGTTINDKLTWSEHVLDRIGAGGQKLWAVRRLAKNNGIMVEVCEDRWRSTVPPTVLHGMASTNMAHSWGALESEYGKGAKACLGMHRLASGHIACNELGWMPPQAHVDILQCMQLWRIQHVAPARARAIHQHIAASGVVSPRRGRRCTTPWHEHRLELVVSTVQTGAVSLCGTGFQNAQPEAEGTGWGLVQRRRALSEGEVETPMGAAPMDIPHFAMQSDRHLKFKTYLLTVC
jgi:hypothetical protein